MLKFTTQSILDVIARGRADAEANGGFRDPYNGLEPGKGEKPRLWLVGDQGVYVMSNGKLPKNDKPLVVYAEECHPDNNGDWFDVKHRTLGGDDGVDFIDAESLEAMIIASTGGTHLSFTFIEDAMEISVFQRG